MIALARRLLADHRIRFLLVGGFNTAFGFAMFVVVDLTLGRALVGIGEALASVVTLIVSHLLAAVVAFFLYRRLVFRVSGNILVDFLRFESVYLIPLAVNAFVLPLLVVWGIHQIAAQAGILIVMTLVSYFGHRYFSFRRPAPDGDRVSLGEDAAGD
jgi:putative flippase GtrA